MNEGVANVMVLGADEPTSERQADPFADPDPYAVGDGEDSWDDLVDVEPTDDPRVAAEAVGLDSPAAMSLHEMLVRGIAG